MGFMSSLFGGALGGISKFLKGTQDKADHGLAGDIGSWWNEINGSTEQMQFSALEAQKNRDWQENMSNTAIQRQMADAKAAGLNPTLIYGGGGGITGANTPSGATASAPGTNGSPMSALLGVISGLNSIRKTNAEIENINADTTKKENESGKTAQETIYTIENTKQVRANIKKILAEANLSEMERQKKFVEIDTLLKQQEQISEQINILKSQGKTAEVQAQFAKAEAIQRQITGYIESLANIAGAVKGTSALPINVHSNSSSAVYHQPFQLY